MERTQARLEQSQSIQTEQLDRIEALLREQVRPKHAGEDPTHRQFPPELLDQAKQLLAPAPKSNELSPKSLSETTVLRTN